MNKLILLIATVGLLAAGHFVFNQKTNQVSEETLNAFKIFKFRYGKTYTAEEEAYRVQVFAQNLKKISNLNAQNDEATFAINKLGDLTAAEFKQYYLGYQAKTNQSNNVYHAQGLKVDAIDWTTKGAVQKVKDQGQCGSCWAFSAVGSMESEAAVHGSGLANLAEQQLVDCSRSYGNYGCNGGLMDYAFEYAIDHGMVNESDYKYTARDGSCKVQSGDFHISKYTDVAQGNCDALAEAIQQQPISVAVDAESWQFYSGGVFSNCGQSLDHGVLLVGIDDSQNWKIKNSWGTSWGEQGFIRLKAGKTCGICLAASWPSQ